MSILDRKTREGIPLREYRPFQLLLAIVPALLFHWYNVLVCKFLKETEPLGNVKIPRNSIVIIFHWDMPISLAAQKTWRKYFVDIGWLGIHNWISYLPSALCYIDGLPAVRFDRRRPRKPMELIEDFLKANPQKPFALRTDAGGPYNKVRPSVLKMAAIGERPIVCMRQTVDKYFRFYEHYFPLPGGTVKTFLSDPIPWSEMKNLPVEEATARLQKIMEDLVKN